VGAEVRRLAREVRDVGAEAVAHQHAAPRGGVCVCVRGREGG
jgi:hypothetical protein